MLLHSTLILEAGKYFQNVLRISNVKGPLNDPAGHMPGGGGGGST